MTIWMVASLLSRPLFTNYCWQCIWLHLHKRRLKGDQIIFYYFAKSLLQIKFSYQLLHVRTGMAKCSTPMLKRMCLNLKDFIKTASHVQSTTIAHLIDLCLPGLAGLYKSWRAAPGWAADEGRKTQDICKIVVSKRLDTDRELKHTEVFAPFPTTNAMFFTHCPLQSVLSLTHSASVPMFFHLSQRWLISYPEYCKNHWFSSLNYNTNGPICIASL